MKKKILIGMSTAFCIALSAVLTVSAHAVPDHNLSEFKLGEHVSGPEVDLSELDGKVVAIEYWGTR